MPKEGLSAAQRSKIRRLASPAEGDVEEIIGHQDVRRVYLGEEFRL